MEAKRRVVMIDPRKINDKSLHPGEIARVEFLSDLHSNIAIVYFDERGTYNAYNVEDLLVIYPERIIFENICRHFGTLEKEAVQEIFTLVTNYQKRYYENSFRIALKNQIIAPLCMTHLGTFPKQKDAETGNADK